MTHYHVTRHSDDDDPYVSDDLFACLDYAATELDQLADMEHEGVSFTVEEVVKGYNGVMSENSVSKYDMEQALLSLAKVETYSNVRLNCLNMVRQNAARYEDRAPLYQVDWEWGTNGRSDREAVREADARLFESARHVMETVNEQTPLSILSCESEMRTWPDEDPMHGGESYCADEYPDGYAGYQDGPCGDY